jgi:hypothetical protein
LICIYKTSKNSVFVHTSFINKLNHYIFMADPTLTFLFGSGVGLILILVAYNLFLKKLPGVKALNSKWVNLILIVLLIANVLWGFNVVESTPASIGSTITGAGLTTSTGAVSAAAPKVQLNTPTSATCSVGVLSTDNQVWYLRCTDAQSNQLYEFNATASVSRANCDKAGYIHVTATSADFKSPSDNTDVKNYNIIQEDNDGTLRISLYNAALNGWTANTTAGAFMEEYDLGFAEGTCVATLGTAFPLSESSTDELNIYDNVEVIYNIGGTIIKVIYTELDAAA